MVVFEKFGKVCILLVFIFVGIAFVIIIVIPVSFLQAGFVTKSLV